MPFSTILTDHPLVRRLLQFRSRPFLCYGVALGLVALATLLRWNVGPDNGLPFVTYFPAVTLTALIAGYRPAILASMLSVLIAVPLFSSDYVWHAGNPAFWTGLFFLAMAAIIICVVALLHKAIDQLIEQERNIRTLIETVPTGIVVVGQDGGIHLINASAERLFGYARHELLGNCVETLLPPRFASAHPAHRETFDQKPIARAMGLGRELYALRKDGSEFQAEVGLSPLLRENRRFTMATVIDVSERKRAQEKERLLARELRHRTSNLFSVIQAIISRSLRADRPVVEIKKEIAGRLNALSNANKLLSQGVLKGANLRELVLAEMSGFPPNVSIEDCDLDLNAQAVQQFALIIHELATNAVKHGALSTSTGRVSISGKIENGAFVFRWVESGGPPVTPPTRLGLGSAILEQSAKSMTEVIHLAYHPDGLLYELRASIPALAPHSIRGSSMDEERPEDRPEPA